MINFKKEINCKTQELSCYPFLVR